MIEPALATPCKKAAWTLAGWAQSGSTVTMQVTSKKPIDARVDALC